MVVSRVGSADAALLRGLRAGVGCRHSGTRAGWIGTPYGVASRRITVGPSAIRPGGDARRSVTGYQRASRRRCAANQSTATRQRRARNASCLVRRTADERLRGQVTRRRIRDNGSRSPGRLRYAFIDARDLFHPAPARRVFRVHQLFFRPVKMVGNEGYLLVQPGKGVAYDPPAASGSISNACWHCGHVTPILCVRLPLMRL